MQISRHCGHVKCAKAWHYSSNSEFTSRSFVAKEAKYPTGEPTEFLTGFLWSVKPSDLDPDIAKKIPAI